MNHLIYSITKYKLANFSKASHTTGFCSARPKALPGFPIDLARQPATPRRLTIDHSART